MSHSEKRRLVRVRDLEEVFGVKYSQRHIRRLAKKGAFPRLVKIGSGPNAITHVYSDEMEAHIAAGQREAS